MASDYNLMTASERKAYREAQIAKTRQAAVEANAGQGLKALDSPNADMPAPLDEQAADLIMRKYQPDPKTDPKGYMQALEQRIADMETRAKEVKKSKSGNVQAEQTYAQVAEILRRRLQAMQNQQMQFAGSQPAVGQ